MSYLLVGNYGAGNLGDEALMEYFLKRFPDVDWRVVSANPKKGEFARFPLGLRSLFKPWWKTLAELKKSKGVVFGGGSLFTDIESRKACILWWWHAFIAWIFRKPIYLAFQGMGPFNTCLGDKLTRWVVDKAEFLSVRDNRSAIRVEHWFKHTNIIQTFDPVILLVETEKKEPCANNVCALIPRENTSREFMIKVKRKAETEQMHAVSILTMRPDDPKERKICNEIRLRCGGEIIEVRSLTALVNEIRKSCCVVTQRYHGALVALALGKPTDIVSQSKGDKLESLKRDMPIDELKKMALIGEKSLMDKLY